MLKVIVVARVPPRSCMSAAVTGNASIPKTDACPSLGDTDTSGPCLPTGVMCNDTCHRTLPFVTPKTTSSKEWRKVGVFLGKQGEDCLPELFIAAACLAAAALRRAQLDGLAERTARRLLTPSVRGVEAAVHNSGDPAVPILLIFAALPALPAHTEHRSLLSCWRSSAQRMPTGIGTLCLVCGTPCGGQLSSNPDAGPSESVGSPSCVTGEPGTSTMEVV